MSKENENQDRTEKQMMCTEQTGGQTNQPCCWAAMELLGSGGRQGSHLQGTAPTLERNEQDDCKDNFTSDNEQHSACLGFL